jgi:hypothetical protein
MYGKSISLCGNLISLYGNFLPRLPQGKNKNEHLLALDNNDN